MSKIENKSVVMDWQGKVDKKHKLNVCKKEVSTELLTDINAGITIEKLDKLKIDYKLPIFKYATQITIHGIFSELNFNYINGYKNIFQNKNKSIGVKWNAIDAEKRIRIAKRLKHKEIRYSSNSSEHFFSQMKYINDKNAESVLEDLTEKLKCFQKSKFYGKANIYSGSIYGSKVLCLEAQINAIYESDVAILFENFNIGDEVFAELELQEKLEIEKLKNESNAKYAKDAEEKNEKMKVLVAEAKSELQENGYENLEKVEINGLGFAVKFDVSTDVDMKRYDFYKTEYKFVLKNVYKNKGQKKARLWKKEFDSFKDMKVYAENKDNEFSHYNDSKINKAIQGIKFKKAKLSSVENMKSVKSNTFIKFNKEKNGIEIYFNEVPNENIRSKMKANAWRWSFYNKCWYNKNTVENKVFAEAI